MRAPAETPRRWAELTHRQKRRELTRMTLFVSVVVVLLGAAYFTLPFDRHLNWVSWVRLVIALAILGGVFTWQLKQIAGSDLPELRAVRALAVIIPFYIVLFASVYLSLAHSSPSYFSQPLNHMAALYFAITVLSSVGFGDIAATSDLPRALVSIQMLLDLVLLGALVRILARAARTGLSRSDTEH